LLYDPQTSGGLLAAVVSTQATAVVAALASASVTAAAIGRVTPPSSPRLSIY
jgi:selenophosphate synthase